MTVDQFCPYPSRISRIKGPDLSSISSSQTQSILQSQVSKTNFEFKTLLLLITLSEMKFFAVTVVLALVSAAFAAPIAIPEPAPVAGNCGPGGDIICM
jgi:hypothetical protein